MFDILLGRSIKEKKPSRRWSNNPASQVNSAAQTPVHGPRVPEYGNQNHPPLHGTGLPSHPRGSPSLQPSSTRSKGNTPIVTYIQESAQHPHHHSRSSSRSDLIHTIPQSRSNKAMNVDEVHTKPVELESPPSDTYVPTYAFNGHNSHRGGNSGRHLTSYTSTGSYESSPSLASLTALPFMNTHTHEQTHSTEDSTRLHTDTHTYTHPHTSQRTSSSRRGSVDGHVDNDKTSMGDVGVVETRHVLANTTDNHVDAINLSFADILQASISITPLLSTTHNTANTVSLNQAALSLHMTAVRACELGDMNAIRALLLKVKNEEIDKRSMVSVLEYRTPAGLNAILTCAKHGRFSLLRLLHSFGVNLHQVDSQRRWGVLHFACWGGHLDIAQYALYHNVHYNERDIHGSTPLLLAADTGHLSLVQLCVSVGAHVNTCTLYHDSALILAAKRGFAAVCQFLLHCGAAVNIRGRKGRTALFNAVAQQHYNIAEMLIAYGADLSICDDSQSTIQEQTGSEGGVLGIDDSRSLSLSIQRGIERRVNTVVHTSRQHSGLTALMTRDIEGRIDKLVQQCISGAVNDASDEVVCDGRTEDVSTDIDSIDTHTDNFNDQVVDHIQPEQTRQPRQPTIKQFMVKKGQGKRHIAVIEEKEQPPQ